MYCMLILAMSRNEHVVLTFKRGSYLIILIMCLYVLSLFVVVFVWSYLPAPWRKMAAIQGTSPSYVSLPPTIRPWGTLTPPHPAPTSTLLHCYKYASRKISCFQLWILYGRLTEPTYVSVVCPFPPTLEERWGLRSLSSVASCSTYYRNLSF